MRGAPFLEEDKEQILTAKQNLLEAWNTVTTATTPEDRWHARRHHRTIRRKLEKLKNTRKTPPVIQPSCK